MGIFAPVWFASRNELNPFQQTLSASVSTQKTVVVGGPRRTPAERKHYSKGLTDVNSTGGSGGGKAGRKGSSGVAPGTKQDNPLSRHLALMERLKPKIQQRNILRSSSGAGGSGRCGTGTVNAVLAAGDGHRRADAAKDRASKKECLLEGSSTAAGVMVSRRARSMGATATAAAAMTHGRAITVRREKSRFQKSQHYDRKDDVRVIDGRKGVESGTVREADQGGLRLPKATERTEGTSGVARVGIQTCPRPCGSGSTIDASKDCGDVGGESVVGSNDTEQEKIRDLGSRAHRREDNAPTPEREVTCRKDAAALPFRTRVGVVSVTRGLSSLGEEEKTTGVTRLKSPGQFSQASGGAAGIRNKDQSSSKLQDSGPSARRRGNTVKGDVPKSTAADEAKLAMAMIDIMSDSPMIAAEPSPKAWRKHKEQGSRSSVLSLATRIVNTVGGAERNSVGGSSDHPALSAGSVRAAGESSAVQVRTKGASTLVSAIDSADAVCGPSMIAPSRRCESVAGSDWKLRASRAVGRAREEGMGKYGTVRADTGTGAMSGVSCTSGDTLAVEGEELVGGNAFNGRRDGCDGQSKSEEPAGLPHGMSRSLPGSPLDDSSTSEGNETTILTHVSSAGTHPLENRGVLKAKPPRDSAYGRERSAMTQVYPIRRVRDSDAESSDDGGATCVKERPPAAAPREKVMKGGSGTGDGVSGAKRSAGGSSKKKASRKTEVRLPFEHASGRRFNPLAFWLSYLPTRNTPVPPHYARSRINLFGTR